MSDGGERRSGSGSVRRSSMMISRFFETQLGRRPPSVEPAPRVPTRRSRFARQLLEAFVGLMLVGLTVRTWALQGVLVPVIVSSGSMAPALLGPHYAVECRNCDLTFACGAESVPVQLKAVCPNCGHTGIDMSRSPMVAGDRLLIDRLTFEVRSPRRWEPAVFLCPEEGRELCIKRIVGLPGETIEIRGGDVFVDGQIARKSFAEQQSMAVPVYDSRHAPSGRKRFIPEREDSLWRTLESNAGFANRPGKGSAPPQGESADLIDWLVYRHRQSPAARGELPPAGPILDDLGYNQNESRVLVEVTDVILRCRLRTAGQGSLFLRAATGSDTFVARFSGGTTAGELTQNSKRVAEIEPLLPLEREVDLTVELTDRQLRISIDGRTVLAFPYEPTPSQRSAGTSQPLAVGTTGLEVEVRDLQVFRDVYHTPRPGASSGDSPVYRLGADEYFVIGDNSSVSEDSRRWSQGPGLPAKLLIGKPLPLESAGR